MDHFTIFNPESDHCNSSFHSKYNKKSSWNHMSFEKVRDIIYFLYFSTFMFFRGRNNPFVCLVLMFRCDINLLRHNRFYVSLRSSQTFRTYFSTNKFPLDLPLIYGMSISRNTSPCKIRLSCRWRLDRYFLYVDYC